MFNLTYSKTIDFSNLTVSYHFKIKDKRTYANYLAANKTYNRQTERIDLYFENSSSTCKNFHTFFDITSGCPPGYSIHYEFKNKKKFFNGEDMEFLQFTNEWNPTFYIYDDTNDIKIPYNGSFELQVIGYGDKESTFKLIEDPTFNTGPNNRVFVFVSDIYASSATSKNNTIIWTCQYGSVCNRVKPENDTLSPPVYYFKLRAKTLPQDTEKSSFCNLEIEFYVKISGIPMDIFEMTKFLSTTLILCFSILFVLYRFYDKLPFMQSSVEIIKIKQD